jgi:hypothetical protein
LGCPSTLCNNDKDNLDPPASAAKIFGLYLTSDRSLLKPQMRENSISYPEPGNEATPADRGNASSCLVENGLTNHCYVILDFLECHTRKG